MAHPCRASRDPLKGAMLVARQSRFHGILGLDTSPRQVTRLPRLALRGRVKGTMLMGRQSRTCDARGRRLHPSRA